MSDTNGHYYQRRTPGWYPDPENPLIQRWWDGNDWSGFTVSGESVREERDLAAQRQDVRYTYAYGMSWWAHLLWLLATLGTFGVAALGWGAWALYRRQTPRRTGLVT